AAAVAANQLRRRDAADRGGHRALGDHVRLQERTQPTGWYDDPHRLQRGVVAPWATADDHAAIQITRPPLVAVVVVLERVQRDSAIRADQVGHQRADHVRPLAGRARISLAPGDHERVDARHVPVLLVVVLLHTRGTVVVRIDVLLLARDRIELAHAVV